MERPGGVQLAAERWCGDGTPVVLLHAGVADRRSWYGTVEDLRSARPDLGLLAYDRRGYGATVRSTEPFRHLDDLLAVLDEAGPGPAWLVGSSAGGGVALDAAITAPERVAGLVLLAPAISGSPEMPLDDDSKRVVALIEAAEEAGDRAEINRLEVWVWLDGPTSAEGRVSGPPRDLALEMNAIALAAQTPDADGASGLDVWSRLDELTLPVTVACGDLDVPGLVERSRHLAERLPAGRHVVLPGLAHLPYLEDPAGVADLIDRAIPSSTAG